MVEEAENEGGLEHHESELIRAVASSSVSQRTKSVQVSSCT